ncbi:MAG: DUF3108 domain-containing protein [Acidobacteria bacterium]|nr:DUF3108 domain-containing protein [Acidobacteriota bacterium]
MRRGAGVLLLAACCASLCAETLQYKIIWPSGVSLGTARLETTGEVNAKPEAVLTAMLLLDASFPGIPVTGEFRSLMDGKGCTRKFEKKLTFALRKTDETTTVRAGTATRQTGGGGGKSTLTVPPCAHDALAFLQQFRRQLSAARSPATVQPARSFLFGAQYTTKATPAGTEKLTIGGTEREADRYRFQVKGPASESEFEILFARDAARTPLQVRVTMALGQFRLELVP